jgi:hypothetical protein
MDSTTSHNPASGRPPELRGPTPLQDSGESLWVTTARPNDRTASRIPVRRPLTGRPARTGTSTASTPAPPPGRMCPGTRTHAYLQVEPTSAHRAGQCTSSPPWRPDPDATSRLPPSRLGIDHGATRGGRGDRENRPCRGRIPRRRGGCAPRNRCKPHRRTAAERPNRPSPGREPMMEWPP